MRTKNFSKKSLFIYLVILIIAVVLSFILRNYLSAKKDLKQKKSHNYVSGVIPHHLVAESVIESFFKELSKKDNPREIVLFGPDHFNASSVYGNKLLTVNAKATDLENLTIDNDLINDIGKTGDVAFSDYAVKNDHAIMDILPFIKKYFPEVKIVPFLIPADFPLDKAKTVTDNLNKILPDNSLILASVDWSHYLPKDVADFHDKKSIRVFLNFEEENFSNIEVDCPQCLYISRYFAKLRDADNHKEIGHKNSQDFSNGEIIDSTTSYFSVLFSNQKTAAEMNKYPKTVLFLGDIMLDRSVKRLMDKNGLLYPVETIRNFLKGTDFVIGNLEGPIVTNPVYTPVTSMELNFGKEALNLMHYAKINLVSLANNHTLDKEKDGLIQTKELLKSRNINYFGDPINCDNDSIYKADGMVIIGLNKTSPINCTHEQINELIENVKRENSSDFVIVFIHWGEEYKPTCNIHQKELAHSMIDAGADLIIGSHPHVVEEIERYNGKLIFYSLGNFIFDQYFSEETQEGLAVGLELTNNKTLIHLFPLGIHKSQPYLFDSAEKIKFLENLSLKSPTVSKNQILNGTIKGN